MSFTMSVRAGRGEKSKKDVEQEKMFRSSD
jgi:hypothetical protein